MLQPAVQQAPECRQAYAACAFSENTGGWLTPDDNAASQRVVAAHLEVRRGVYIRAIASAMNASMSAAGRAPVVRFTSRPPANSAIVGMERMV